MANAQYGGGSAISNMDYGFDANGVNTYLEAMRSNALNKAKDAVENIQTLVTCCEANWQGTARENFVKNLQRDAMHCSAQFERLYQILVNEVNDITAEMANKDKELITEDSIGLSEAFDFVQSGYRG